MRHDELYKTYSIWKQSYTVGSYRDIPLLYGTRFDLPEFRWLPAKKSARIAEVGCGTGEFLSILRRRGYVNLSGCDINAPERLPPEVRFEKSDAFAFLGRFADDSVDAVIGRSVLEHLVREDAGRFFALLEAKLAPGGRALLIVPNMSSPLGLAHGFGDLTHELQLTPSSLDQLITASVGRRLDLKIHPYPSLLRRSLSPRNWLFLPFLVFAIAGLRALALAYGQNKTVLSPDLLVVVEKRREADEGLL